uniref:NADH dehydrogenase [ubiquinone] 1 alpha subcomplex subunit 12 n=1 Tax=Aegilops tauschii subsp. strangulata TaxID=200361 RepID=A0A453L6R2_AEGTS
MAGRGGAGAMSKRLMERMLGMFRSRTQVGVDRAGNHYFSRVEEVDGAMKEKRWIEFKGDRDPTTVPVEWICWLNGQRKKAPTPEELAELEARRERVKQNVELLKKKEEEERRAGVRPVKTIGVFFMLLLSFHYFVLSVVYPFGVPSIDCLVCDNSDYYSSCSTKTFQTYAVAICAA